MQRSVAFGVSKGFYFMKVQSSRFGYRHFCSYTFMRFTFPSPLISPRIAAAVLGYATIATATSVVPSWVGAQTPARATDAPSSASVAFVDVSVVPMDRERVLDHQTVISRDGRIVTMGPSKTTRVPKTAQRIDGRGAFLMPGLADMHSHLAAGVHIATVPTQGGWFPVDVPMADSAATAARLFLWLANGVTTIRNLDYFNDEWATHAKALRTLSMSGTAWIPRIYTAGKWGPLNYIGGAAGENPKPQLDSIAAYIAAYKAAGFDVLKVHNETPEILDSVLVAAKRVGMPVVGHVPPPTRVEHVLEMRGYTSIEHPFTDYLWNNRQTPGGADTAGFGVLVSALRKADVWHCPTQQHYDRLHFVGVSMLKVEQDSGIKMLLGTDEVPWLGVITRELQSMVGVGLTPYQALLTGTRNVATYWGTENESGTVAIGKRADLILLTGNPLKDIRYTAQPLGVMIGGRWLPRAEITRMLASYSIPTFDHNGMGDTLIVNGPVKTYWHNVADEFNEGVMPVLRAVALVDSQPSTVGRLRAQQHTKLVALVDSLGVSDQYQEGTQRIVELIAAQVGEFRAALTESQRTVFDPGARTWMQHMRAAGYNTLNIPGLS